MVEFDVAQRKFPLAESQINYPPGQDADKQNVARKASLEFYKENEYAEENKDGTSLRSGSNLALSQGVMSHHG